MKRTMFQLFFYTKSQNLGATNNIFHKISFSLKHAIENYEMKNVLQQTKKQMVLLYHEAWIF